MVDSPRVSCVSSELEAISKWLNYNMQSLLHLAPAYLKDSDDLLDDLSAMSLPQNAWFFTSDADSMYTNINSHHTITVFRRILTMAPDDFPKSMFIQALELVMSSNIFQFDDTYWLQKNRCSNGHSICMPLCHVILCRV